MNDATTTHRQQRRPNTTARLTRAMVAATTCATLIGCNATPQSVPTSTTTTTTAPTTTTTTVPTTGSAAWAVGYYPWYQATEVTPAAFPYSKVSHVAIGNVEVTTAGCCSPSSGAETIWNSYATSTVSAAHAAGRKVLVQIGGSTNSGDSWIAGTSSPAATDALASQIVSFVKGLGADGVDLDWELNVDFAAEGRLAKSIRSKWSSALIVMAIDVFDSDLSWTTAVVPYVDKLNAMTYIAVGNWGGWDGPGHQGPLYGDTDTHRYSINRRVTAMLQAGIPSSKIGIGLGLFGSAYGDSNKDGDCPTAPASGWGGEWGVWFADSSLPLRDIERLYAPYMTRTFDSLGQVPYLSAPAPGAGGEADGWLPKVCYITYEDVASAKAKAAYVTKNKLGSVIMWTVPEDRRDDGSFPVVDALWNGLHG